VGQRRGIILAVVGVGLAVLGIFAITRLVGATPAPVAAPTPIPPITVSVVVTTHDIEVRSLLAEEDLEVIEVPIELVAFNAVSDIDTVVGKIAKIPFVAGEMVFEHHLADPTNVNGDYAFIIEDDEVLLAIPATDLMSEINILQPGDLVDILATVEQEVTIGEAGVTSELSDEEQEQEPVLFTFNALQQIEISAIVVEIIPDRSRASSSASTTSTSSEAETEAQPTPTPEPAEIIPQAVLLALKPQDALVLKHIKDAGGIIDIVLRSPTSNQIFELSPVTSDYLRDRYELIIER
jgi:pilus assembly protein CpaB